ncbi:hypothetical protein P7K49_024713 [Saguinus oedipus]|uniref:Uncharacterized protein n=1 Tax=Saguinus oedipus TaxID=9490 RepID=A0ABQ9USK6_SAGOE|nr:hypothetical protein P7K49_024713 [Saguinus oedipus]
MVGRRTPLTRLLNWAHLLNSQDFRRRAQPSTYQVSKACGSRSNVYLAFQDARPLPLSRAFEFSKPQLWAGYQCLGENRWTHISPLIPTPGNPRRIPELAMSTPRVRQRDEKGTPGSQTEAKGRQLGKAPCGDTLLSHPARRRDGSCWLPLQRRAQALTDHGGPSCQCCLGALTEVVSRGHAQDGHLQPCVDVNSTGKDHQAMGVNGLDAPRDDEVFSDLSESSRGFAGHSEPRSEPRWAPSNAQVFA